MFIIQLRITACDHVAKVKKNNKKECDDHSLKFRMQLQHMLKKSQF